MITALEDSCIQMQVALPGFLTVYFVIFWPCAGKNFWRTLLQFSKKDLVSLLYFLQLWRQRSNKCSQYLYAPFEKLMNYKISFCFAWLPQCFLNWVYTSRDIKNSYRQWLRIKSQRLSLEQYIQNVGLFILFYFTEYSCFVFVTVFIIFFLQPHLKERNNACIDLIFPVLIYWIQKALACFLIMIIKIMIALSLFLIIFTAAIHFLVICSIDRVIFSNAVNGF